MGKGLWSSNNYRNLCSVVSLAVLCLAFVPHHAASARLLLSQGGTTNLGDAGTGDQPDPLTADSPEQLGYSYDRTVKLAAGLTDLTPRVNDSALDPNRKYAQPVSFQSAQTLLITPQGEVFKKPLTPTNAGKDQLYTFGQAGTLPLVDTSTGLQTWTTTTDTVTTTRDGNPGVTSVTETAGVAGTGTGTGVDASLGQGDPRTPVLDTTVSPYRAVVYLQGTDPDDPTVLHTCSGACVGPSHVLTAAHCVFLVRQDQSVGMLNVTAAMSGTYMPFGGTQMKHARVLEAYQACNTYIDCGMYHDFALVTLTSEDMCTRAGWMSIGADVSSGDVNSLSMITAGYPGDKGGSTMWTERCDFSDGPWKEQPAEVPSSCVVSGGQSGSPFWKYWTNPVTNQSEPQINFIFTAQSTTSNLVTVITPEVFQSLTTWLQEDGVDILNPGASRQVLQPGSDGTISGNQPEPIDADVNGGDVAGPAPAPAAGADASAASPPVSEEENWPSNEAPPLSPPPAIDPLTDPNIPLKESVVQASDTITASP